MKKLFLLFIASLVNVVKVFASPSGKIIAWGDIVCSPSVFSEKILDGGNIICSSTTGLGKIIPLGDVVFSPVQNITIPEIIILLIFLGIIGDIIYTCFKNK
ncbi:hypothetical protein HON86_03415 [Candidatus Woesearchaeota archaeon]|jgi:hypothetical protein|nr:hypothetical protein [Candidatus Woesearchaeota archaeon]MBT6735399.1 hypothetical protein [Candidatus Woesearchaeota archaeon]MBT7169722.1 hypothetical protein [Candidatus Woesearchaeota archaeon]MBT7474670.1 hypothetical protein [Candidatus Woesearchaeota archaeon]